MNKIITALLGFAWMASFAVSAGEAHQLRIICFGAHPDDCEIQAGGVAAMWAARGHKVKFVSTTNGDIGHWREAGGPLALRRKAEVEKAAKILGIETEVLDIHDGEILPTLENRKKIVRLIREWNADIVMGPRPNDYHPDHRYTSVLVQDAAYMVTVPFFCPDVPFLKHNPVFFYFPDGFQKPNPFQPDVAISIDSVIEKKLDALDTLESQFYEGGANGSADLIPSDPQKQQERKRQVRQSFDRRNQNIAQRFRSKLTDFYGESRAHNIKYAEAFEICEYGARPNQAELKRLFPFSDNSVSAGSRGFEPLFPEDGVPQGWTVRRWNDLKEPADAGVVWQVKDGVLHGSDPRGTWLISEKEYSDFTLEFEWKLGERGNSGLALRAPMFGDPAFDGLELQMVDPRYYPPDMNVPESELTGSLYRAVGPSAQVYRPEEWNKYEITCTGPKVIAVLNGTQILDINLDEQTTPTERHDGSKATSLKERPRKGHIGFQELSRGGGHVEIRNARIKLPE